MKKETEISSLLDKYYDGETSPDEEVLLAEMLDGCADDELTADRDLFSFIAGSRDIEIDGDFDDAVMQRIAERNTVKFRLPMREFMLVAGSIAAALALVFITGIKSFTEQEKFSNPVKITNENYAQMKSYAKSEMSSAFDKISEKIRLADREMNKLDKIEPALKTIDKMNVMFNKGNIE